MTSIDDIRARFRASDEEESAPRVPVVVPFAGVKFSPLDGSIVNPFTGMKGCPACASEFPEMDPSTFPVSYSSHRDPIKRISTFVWACEEGHTSSIPITDGMIEELCAKTGSIVAKNVGPNGDLIILQQPRGGAGVAIPVLRGTERLVDLPTIGVIVPKEGDAIQLPLLSDAVFRCDITRVWPAEVDGTTFYKCLWDQAGERNGECTVVAGVVISWSQIQFGAVVKSSLTPAAPGELVTIPVGVHWDKTALTNTDTAPPPPFSPWPRPIEWPLRVMPKQGATIQVMGTVYGPGEVVELGSGCIHDALGPGGSSVWNSVIFLGYGPQIIHCTCGHEKSMHQQPLDDSCLYRDDSTSMPRTCRCRKFIQRMAPSSYKLSSLL